MATRSSSLDPHGIETARDQLSAISRSLSELEELFAVCRETIAEAKESIARANQMLDKL